jgi:galactofuranose transport system substrate-binding protein
MLGGGKQVMEAFITTDGNKINVVYAHNDDMALAAIQMLEVAGMHPGKDVVVSRMIPQSMSSRRHANSS